MRKWTSENTERWRAINGRAVKKYAESDKGRGMHYFASLRHLYGLTEDGFWDLVHQQEYSCPVCGFLLFDGKEHNIDHEPGSAPARVRGILHGRCNNIVARVENGYNHLSFDDPRYGLVLDYLQRSA